MENAAHFSRPDAKIIQLRPSKISPDVEKDEILLPSMMDLFALQQIDQLLEEHFK